MNIKNKALSVIVVALLVSCGSGKKSSQTSDSSLNSSSNSSEEVISSSSSDNSSSESQKDSSKEQSSEESESSSSEQQSSSEIPSSSEKSESSSSEIDSSSEEHSDSSSSEEHEDPAFTMQDGTILHAFNWSMNNIKNELNNIKKAGFTSVQLSPMQPQKDFYQGYWGSQWWKLYQPYGFSIAKNNQNVLGNKNDLISLCNEAKKVGVKIIVDVVTNHLAGGSKTSINSNVNNFEPTIYNNKLIHTYGDWAKDTNLQSIVQGNIGDYPDLKTEDSRVQERVISLLKEYCDCGVDGFRFDAAKHIETPDDGTYKSDYWPNVTGAINDYYINKGLDKPYIYGEILTTCGSGRSYASYTKYMSTIDNKQASSLLTAVNNKSLSSIKTTYNTGVNPDHLVLWAESHDTYSNDDKETTNISSDIINKTYMIQASRKDASSLYLVRPGNSNMGEIGTTDYKKDSIRGANLFHNYYAHKNESISLTNGAFINVRGNGEDNGAAIININNSSNTVKMSLPLANGTYKDLITNNKVTVSSGNATISFTDGACFLLPENVDPEQIAPTIDIKAGKEVFKDSTSITISVDNATTSYYQINGGSAVNFDGNATFNVGNGLDNGEVTIKVTATNKNGTNTKSISLLKTSLADKSLIIKNVTDLSHEYLIWCWQDGKDGSWYQASKENNMLGYDLPYDNYIVVKFANGTTAKTADWSNNLGQTKDLKLTSQIIDFSSLEI